MLVIIKYTNIQTQYVSNNNHYYTEYNIQTFPTKERIGVVEVSC